MLNKFPQPEGRSNTYRETWYKWRNAVIARNLALTVIMTLGENPEDRAVVNECNELEKKLEALQEK